MNKAFVREPDRTVDYCPRCGSQGEPVGEETLEAFLSAEQRRRLADPANFCPSPQCEVAYFDSFERTIPARELARPVYPKDPAAPICGCLGLAWADIESDAEQGVTARAKAALELARSTAAGCRRTMPNGRSCVANVQKCYLQSLPRKA